MKAVGEIQDAANTAEGRRQVKLYVRENINRYVGVRYTLDNEDDLPVGHPAIGLFEFEPQDQFCTWIDPNK